MPSSCAASRLFLGLSLVASAAAYGPGVPFAKRRSIGPSMLQEVNKQGWCQQVENADRLAVVFFYAPWCRTCKAVRPRLERLERQYEATFFQCNFKKEAALCYEERVFTFPTVHFYLPGIGRVSRSVLTVKNTDTRMRETLARFVDGGSQVELLQAITTEALRPVVQYKELVSALQGLAELAAPKEQEWSELAPGLSPAKESARLRAMVEGDEQWLAQLEGLFRSLDVDADGQLELGDAETAAQALQPAGMAAGATSNLVEKLQEGDRGASLGVDKETFIALMIDKAVQDFAAGEKALLPAFQALDADGDGTITQTQLLTAIENFCNAIPEADGCEIDQRPLRLAEAFDAFANEERLLDYERFVEMVSGRKESEECEVGEEEVAGRKVSSYLQEELEMMGERECFGEATTDEGEDDPGCDAWFYGQDPLEGKRQEDPNKQRRLREAAEIVTAMKRKRQEAEAAELAKRQTAGAAPKKVIRLFG